MKQYKVIYYDGKERQAMYVRAKSINDAINKGNEQLRSYRSMSGSSVIGAERIKAQDMPILVINKAALGSMSIDELAAAYNSPTHVAIIPSVELPGWEKSVKEWITERFTKSRPMKPKHITELIRQGIIQNNKYHL